MGEILPLQSLLWASPSHAGLSMWLAAFSLRLRTWSQVLPKSSYRHLINAPTSAPTTGLDRNGVPLLARRGDLPLEITSGGGSQQPFRGPPSSALRASRRPRARPPSEHNTEFLNVPDQGMAG